MSKLSFFSNPKFQAFGAIVSRNIFILINGIIFAVVMLLIVLGDSRDGVFIGLITVLNIVIGCAQEINAWLTLERLQLLSVPKVIVVKEDGTESAVLAEKLKGNDCIKIKIGDQVPCDGVLVTSHGFEVNEGLITGESTVFLKKPGDSVFAGSIITSGSGILRIEKIFSESRIALMTQSIKKYSFVLSPIQSSINTIIKYISYVLLLVIFFVGGKGIILHESTISIVQNIGALTSVLLPQGMVVAVTLFLSYGAIYLYRKSILIQEISATEKIGRIKNLCIDKTGTLTDNKLVVENKYLPSGMDEKFADESIAAYIKSSGNSSQTIEVIKEFSPAEYKGTIIDDLTFSSSRQFGVVHAKDAFGERVILAGAPDVFLPYFSSLQDTEWLQKYIDTEAKLGKRLICFVRSDANVLPQNLSGIKLSTVALYVIDNKLREGVIEAVRFFQNRNVTIRIISGDNPETVQAVAVIAGVLNANSVVSGPEIENWADADFLEKARTYTIFARVKPEQKEKIIEALKKDGFTAMIGDGANDALAIKKADLGIAMFDGAQITRQIASIVLVKNSFLDLPTGVELADRIIQNIEVCGSIFFNQTFLNFFFFVILTVSGYLFPLTPLNITFIDYFTIGVPISLISYWMLRSKQIQVIKHNQSFLMRTLPFAVVSAVPQAFIMMFAFYGSLEYRETHGPTSLVLLSFIIVGVIFFIYTSKIYSGAETHKKQFALLVVAETVCIFVLIKIPLIATFYNLKAPPLDSVLELIPLIILYLVIQYGITRKFLIPKQV